MASDQDRKELDERAKHGETVVPGGTGGKSLEAQEHLAEGSIIIIYGTVVGFICLKYYVPFCGCVGRSKGGQTRKGQIGTEGYQEMGRKGGLSTNEESSREREGISIDESKFRNKS
ncbi:hypothetical protein LguiA_034823 [Lonicera macranthoides]